MKTITDINHIELQPSVATIGFFDGVHCGHRFLMRQVVDEAKRRGLSSMIITFSCHPRQVMKTDYRPMLLSVNAEKSELLAQTEVDQCVFLPFDREMAACEARDFMENVLLRKLNVRVLVIGYDHHFGKGASETFEDYVRYGEEVGIEVVRAEEYQAEGTHISSSVIRRALLMGNVELAALGLERYYSLSGKVVPGFKIGSGLGFPTANISVGDSNKLIPMPGVYAVWVDRLEKGERYAGMLNIGVRPTIGEGSEMTIEVHLLDFEGDLYGEELTVHFVNYLRSERKFENREELIEQLQKDREIVRKLLTSAEEK